MKIKKVSTEQFAGIRDKEISFADGINVVYGKNEAGKSTLVNLISGLLFRDVKLKLNNNRDKEFKANAFPAGRTDGKRFDSINGTAVIDTPSGEYKLVKEWGDEEYSKLFTPDGIIKNQKQINEILAAILGYGEGVYKEMLLSPQSNAAENLQKVLKSECETSRTLADAVSRTFAESDGISIDKMENKINDAIFELVGKWWDTENMCPVKKDYTEKSQQLGEIMKALIQSEKAETNRQKLEELENEYNKALDDFSEKKALVDDAETELKEFDKYYECINAVDLNKKIIDDCKRNIERYKNALDEFPKDRSLLEKAEALEAEKKNRMLLDQYDTVKKYHDALQEINGKLDRLYCPESDEIKAVRSAERDIPILESMLRGMDIIAKIKMLGGNPVKITSLLSGKEIALNGDDLQINEAVRVEIPGIMEMELSPAGVNIDDISLKIAECKKKRADIFAKYDVDSVEEIEQLEKIYHELANNKKIAENDLRSAEYGMSFEELEQKAAAFTNIRSLDIIDGEISELCGGIGIAEFIGKKKQAIVQFTADFESRDNLTELIYRSEKEQKKAQSAIDSAEKVPEKYADISDPKGYKNILQNILESTRIAKENALAEMTNRQRDLDLFTENHGDSLDEMCLKANREFDEKVGLLRRWLRIKKVFDTHKAALASDPLETLANDFVKNLGYISGDRVTAKFIEAGKPGFKVSSGAYDMDFIKLSDGTKETVYLAFRLAVLDHLFPEGGGVIVLDDPLNDMDIDRAKQSCELIMKSAERHQIIFLTCREEYAKWLGGNMIHI